MLSIKECSKILNKKGQKYTEEEVKEIRDWLYHIADIAIESSKKSIVELNNKRSIK